MPAPRAAAIRSVCTCDTKPSVRTVRSAGSAFMAAIASSGRIFALFRSKMTSDGCLSRMLASTLSGLRSKNTDAPSALAAVEILTEKSRSSTAQSTILSL